MKINFFQRAFFASLIIIVSVAIFFSCRKLDTTIRRQQTEIDYAKRFLTVPSNAPSAIKRIAETIRKQNDEAHFLFLHQLLVNSITRMPHQILETQF